MADPWKQFPRPEARRPGRGRLVLTQGVVLLAAAVIIGAATAWTRGLRASNAVLGPVPAEIEATVASLDRALTATRGELEVTRLQLERATEVLKYSARYRIPADLTAAIYDIAIAEGLHPSLGYQLVKVESGFRAQAVSSKGAVGYTQVRLPTARIYQPGITERELMDRDTNLRIGFRFLKDLLKRFDNDLPLALVAYNRGPTLVDSIISGGGDPSNGYSEAVLRGVSRTSGSTSRPLKRGS